MNENGVDTASTPAPAPLALAPAGVCQAGQPASGRYAGCVEAVDWSDLSGEFRRSSLWKRLHHKRWHYVGIGNAQCFIGLAMVDVGWTNTAFVYVFDRYSKTLLVDATQDGLPGLTAHLSDRPLQGARSWFRFAGMDLRLENTAPGTLAVHARVGKMLRLDATLTLPPGSACLTAIGPIADGGCAHATVKSSALQTRGQLVAAGRSIGLDDACASFDYSNGLLARNTAWRWASAHAPEVGFNLQQGYFGTQENVLWLHGQPWPLGAAQFDFDPQSPLKPWHIHTDDGLLDLQFTPEGARQESKNLLVAASYYIQPIGTFRGTVRAHAGAPLVAVDQLLGVTEDHRSKW